MPIHLGEERVVFVYNDRPDVTAWPPRDALITGVYRVGNGAYYRMQKATEFKQDGPPKPQPTMGVKMYVGLLLALVASFGVGALLIAGIKFLIWMWGAL